MGDEKSNNEDKLQKSEEIGYQSLSNESNEPVCSTGISDVGTVDVPLNVLSNYPSFCMRDMSLVGVDGMRSAPHLDSYQNFAVYPHLLNRIDHMPSQYSPLENMDANTEYLQTDIWDIKMDDGNSQSLENSMRCGNKEHLLRGAQDGSEMGSNDTLVDCVVQSNYPESLDGSFLTLGIGVDREARSNYNNGAINMQLNQSHSRSDYGSFFSSDFKMAAGLSDFQTYAAGLSGIEENAVGLSSLKHTFGGLPSIVQNASESSNVSALTGSSPNVDSCTFSTYDFRFAASTISNLSSTSSQMLPIPQSHVQHPFLSSGNRKFNAGFANMDPNKALHGLSGMSSNGEHIKSHSELLPNQSFPTVSGSSSIVHSCGQSGQPFQASLPSLSSFVRSKYAAVNSDQLQKCDIGSIPSLQRGTSVSSVLGNIENTSSRSDVWQDYPAHQDAAIQTVEKALFSKRIQNQLAGKDKLSTTDGNAAEVVSILPSSNNVGFQEATSLGQPRNNTSIQASNNLVPAYTYGQNGPAATPNNRTRSSLKRKPAQSPAAIPQVQIKRTAKFFARSPAVNMAQNAPYISHVPSMAHPISSVPPLRVTPQPSVQATTISLSARRSLSPHVKWQDRDSLEPSGYKCLLCKRDLSYRPEGPILPLTAPPPVAVLSCGHCFHELCLQRMTPEDEANSPPCIPCVIGEG
ncbi:uncharacterized protein LOC120119596 isoform X2 [Hibiscus syriacus]|uniref:uncharacterized protein LOC120119596 isoform X2 n=1 Tax=Hibiscus syriacus TaxID=106335 RepID=UPI0019247211|nr:uncharacterized protein LOC120119596 isoform X2 [Hibiscus syriacus]